ncbi:MAG: DedA family protein [Gammaproteobacteria bacterium]
MSLTEILESFKVWSMANPHWAGFIVFLLSISESLVLVGLVVPGIPIMAVVGYLMGSGALPWLQTMLWAILGAIVGDGISYWVGHRYKDDLRDIWPFNKMTRFFDMGEQFFLKHGGKGIIFGRFVGPVRPMIPAVAGMMNMRPREFIFFNVISAFLWAPIYCLPGILLGISLNTLPSKVAERVSLLVIALLLSLWLIYSLILFGLKALQKIYQRSVRILWVTWNQPAHSEIFPNLRNLLRDSHHPNRNQIGSLISVVLFFALFILILSQVLQAPLLINCNLPIFQLASALYHSKPKWIATILVHLTQVPISIFFIFLFGAFLGFKKHWASFYAWSISLGLTIGFGILLNHSTALCLDNYTLIKPAPCMKFPNLQLLCFSQTLGLFLGFMRPHLKISERWLSAAIFIPVLILVTLSLLYSEQILISDLIGSLLLGLVGMSLGLMIYFRWQNNPIPKKHLLVPGGCLYLLAILLGFGYSSVLQNPKFNHHYNHLNTASAPQTVNLDNWRKGDIPKSLRCRIGAVKQKCNDFNIQYLGNLNELSALLQKKQWELLPDFSFIEALNLLSGDSNIKLQPMPEFHRDELPSLKMVKAIPNSQHTDLQKRLILQIWPTEEDKILVGSLRIESLHQRKYLSFFSPESVDSVLEYLKQDLESSDPSFNKFKMLNIIQKSLFIELGS